MNEDTQHVSLHGEGGGGCRPPPSSQNPGRASTSRLRCGSIDPIGNELCKRLGDSCWASNSSSLFSFCFFFSLLSAYISAAANVKRLLVLSLVFACIVGAGE